jgi:hypothetical protein
LPELVWLVLPAGADPAAFQAVQNWLEQKSAGGGMLFETKDPAALNNAPENLRLAVFAAPDPAAANWAAAFPQTRVIILDDPSTEPAANLSVVRPAVIPQAFIAGYIATLVAPDLRSAALFDQNDPQLSLLRDGFQNGGRYFCGRCAPVFAPVVLFPQTGVLNLNDGVESWKAAFDTLHQNRIQILYLPGSVARDTQFLDYLAAQNVAVLAAEPPPDGYQDQWVVSIHKDTLSALDTLWQEWQSGAGGQALLPAFKLDNINPDRLSEGRLRLIQHTMSELQGGWIAPLSVP